MGKNLTKPGREKMGDEGRAGNETFETLRRHFWSARAGILPMHQIRLPLVGLGRFICLVVRIARDKYDE
jgi:hypothetical protein